MVTHHWKNIFTDLVAAIVADVVGETCYDRFSVMLQKCKDPDSGIADPLAELKKQAAAAERRRLAESSALALDEHEPLSDDDVLSAVTYWVCAISHKPRPTAVCAQGRGKARRVEAPTQNCAFPSIQRGAATMVLRAMQHRRRSGVERQQGVCRVQQGLRHGCGDRM
jgi:hypothetical protein